MINVLAAESFKAPSLGDNTNCDGRPFKFSELTEGASVGDNVIQANPTPVLPNELCIIDE
jgi:hypothetical protein